MCHLLFCNCFWCRRCTSSSRGISSSWTRIRLSTAMVFRNVLGCAWVRGHVVGKEGTGEAWTVQAGEMTSRLTVEALHPGLITWGSFWGAAIFFLSYASMACWDNVLGWAFDLWFIFHVFWFWNIAGNSKQYYQVSPLQGEQGHTRGTRSYRKDGRGSGSLHVLLHQSTSQVFYWVAQFSHRLVGGLNFHSQDRLDLQGQRINVLLQPNRYALSFSHLLVYCWTIWVNMVWLGNKVFE